MLVLLAATMWSTSGLFAKAPFFDDWPVAWRGILLAFWRTLFAALFLLPWIRKPRWHWGLIPATLMFAAMSITYLMAITQTTAANAIWLQQTAPLWVVIIGIVVLREPVTTADWMMVAAVVAGVGLIVGCETWHAKPGETHVRGVILALVSGICYASVIISVRALRHMDAAWLIGMNHLVTAVVLLPLVWQWGALPSATQLGWTAGFGLLQMGVPYILFARSVRRIPSHHASFLALLEPMLVPIWVYLAWGSQPGYDPPSWWTFTGAGMILLGLVLRFGWRNPAR